MVESKDFDILYKRSKTGKIQYWKIYTEDNTIIKESGQFGTKNPIIHKEIVEKGKNIGRSNETTPIQQAILQATSDWKSKHDEGYKSLDDLGIIEYIESGMPVFHIEESGKKVDLITGLEIKLPKFNNTQSGVPLPMLAKKVQWNKVTYPCIVQPKLDGLRALLIVSPNESNFTVNMYTRKGKEITTLYHIIDDVQEFLSKQDKVEPFILDGEIFTEDLTFQEIVAATKKNNSNSPLLKMRVYDIINDDVQTDRNVELNKIVELINSPNIVKVESYSANSKSEIQEFHNKFVSQGYEGAMIRTHDGKYAQGQRSSDLMKVKEFDDDEFEFVGFLLGQRGVEDIIAVCKSNKSGLDIKAKMKGSRAEKELLYTKEEELRGKLLTVRYFGFTDDGNLRFPIGIAFRDYE